MQPEIMKIRQWDDSSRPGRICCTQCGEELQEPRKYDICDNCRERIYAALLPEPENANGKS